MDVTVRIEKFPKLINSKKKVKEISNNRLIKLVFSPKIAVFNFSLNFFQGTTFLPR